MNGIIKQEWLYRMRRPRDIREARNVITDIIDFYNNKRPHMNNEGMLPPRVLRNKLARRCKGIQEGHGESVNLLRKAELYE